MCKGRSLRGSRWLVVALLPMAAVLGGCASPFAAATTGFVDLESSRSGDSKSAKAKGGATDAALAGGSGTGSSTVATAANAQMPLGSGFPPLSNDRGGGGDGDLALLASDMRLAGTLTPAEQQALLDDLKQTDPSLWPTLVHQFRIAMAYRNRGQGSGVRGQGITEETPTEAASPSPDKDGSAATAHQARSGANSSLAVDEAMPTEPALRPPLKSGEHKTVDKTAGSKSGDADPAKRVVKAAATTADAAQATASGESQLQLTKAILALEGEGAGASSAAAEIARQMQLRLLYVSAGRRDDALRPVPGLSAAQQEFWTKEVYGLVTYLDSERAADPERRATEAALHLREAAGRLGELASPVVRNLAFCKEVTSFGVFKKFPKYEFKPGEEALLYCEIENLKAESTDRGYHTSVKSSYQILDSRGERVAEQEFPASDDYCSSQRRDFFIPYFIAIPKRINDGAYTLQLTVEDTQTKKVGQASIQFNAK